MRPKYKIVLLVAALAIVAITLFATTRKTNNIEPDPRFHKTDCDSCPVDPSRTYISFETFASGELFVTRIEEKKNRVVLHIVADRPHNCGSESLPCGANVTILQGTIPHTDKPIFVHHEEGSSAYPDEFELTP
jgi:hypothetical protein